MEENQLLGIYQPQGVLVPLRIPKQEKESTSHERKNKNVQVMFK